MHEPIQSHKTVPLMQRCCKYGVVLWNLPCQIITTVNGASSRILNGPGTKSRFSEGPETFLAPEMSDSEGHFGAQKVFSYNSAPCPPPLPWASCLSFSVFLYVSPVELSEGRGRGGGRRAKLDDRERACPSKNHSILSGSSVLDKENWRRAGRTGRLCTSYSKEWLVHVDSIRLYCVQKKQAPL